MVADKHGQDAQDEADAIILRCVEKGLGALGGSAAAINYIETISGMSLKDVPRNSESFIWALRHVFRYGSVLILKSIVKELDAAKSENRDALAQVRIFSHSLTEGIKSIESGIM